MKNQSRKILDFQKPDAEKLAPPSSVRLTPEQDAFVKKYNINLSKLVRAALEDLMIVAKENVK